MVFLSWVWRHAFRILTTWFSSLVLVINYSADSSLELSLFPDWLEGSIYVFENSPSFCIQSGRYLKYLDFPVDNHPVNLAWVETLQLDRTLTATMERSYMEGLERHLFDNANFSKEDLLRNCYDARSFTKILKSTLGTRCCQIHNFSRIFFIIYIWVLLKQPFHLISFMSCMCPVWLVQDNQGKGEEQV